MAFREVLGGFDFTRPLLALTGIGCAQASSELPFEQRMRDVLLEAFETYWGTHCLVVPTMLISMLDHPDRPRRDLSSIQTILGGAAAVPASLVRRTSELLGCRFGILFGQTETHGVISQTRITDEPEDQTNTVGQPLPQLEVKIADSVTGEPRRSGRRARSAAAATRT